MVLLKTKDSSRLVVVVKDLINIVLLTITVLELHDNDDVFIILSIKKFQFLIS